MWACDLNLKSNVPNKALVNKIRIKSFWVQKSYCWSSPRERERSGQKLTKWLVATDLVAHLFCTEDCFMMLSYHGVLWNHLIRYGCLNLKFFVCGFAYSICTQFYHHFALISFFFSIFSIILHHHSHTIEIIVVYLNFSHDNYGQMYARFQVQVVWFRRLTDGCFILVWPMANKSNKWVSFYKSPESVKSNKKKTFHILSSCEISGERNRL